MHKKKRKKKKKKRKKKKKKKKKPPRPLCTPGKRTIGHLDINGSGSNPSQTLYRPGS